MVPTTVTSQRRPTAVDSEQSAPYVQRKRKQGTGGTIGADYSALSMNALAGVGSGHTGSRD